MRPVAGPRPRLRIQTDAHSITTTHTACLVVLQGNEYYMCPPGVHEGDLEHMSLLVSVARYNESNPFDSIMRVQYAAHSWNSQVRAGRRTPPPCIRET